MDTPGMATCIKCGSETGLWRQLCVGCAAERIQHVGLCPLTTEEDEAMGDKTMAVRNTCPNCGAPEVPGSDGEYQCGTRWKRPPMWKRVLTFGLARRRLAKSHACVQSKACADAGMVLIAECINANAQCRTWGWSDVLGPNGKGFGDWYLTVGRKTKRRGK